MENKEIINKRACDLWNCINGVDMKNIRLADYPHTIQSMKLLARNISDKQESREVLNAIGLLDIGLCSMLSNLETISELTG